MRKSNKNQKSLSDFASSWGVLDQENLLNLRVVGGDGNGEGGGETDPGGNGTPPPPPPDAG